MKRLSSSALLLVLSGCTWISNEDVEGRLSQLDDDGDGFTIADGDCDDAKPGVHPGADEIWYDGVDQDCTDENVADDDYDQDLDGFFASAREGTPAAEVDCNDSAPTVYPGAPDTWYDNLDSDCAGDDDFDQDKDGHKTLTAGGGDCDDTIPAVKPGAPDDWYDGVDTNCDGEDDYDQDGDGYVRAEDVGKDTTYCSTGCGNGKSFDCDDEDPLIYKGATDAWYDGTDSNCAGDDDYDQDLDGFQEATAPGVVDIDCDDKNADAYPGGLEVLTDSADQDCDGGGATFAPAEVLNVTLTNPSSIRAEESASQVYFSVAAEQIVLNSSSTTLNDTAVAFAWTFTDPMAGVKREYNWVGNTSDPGEVMGDGQTFRNDATKIYGAVGFTGADSRTLLVRQYDTSTSSAKSIRCNLSDTTAPFTDVAMGLDSYGKVHAIGCDADGNLHYTSATATDLSNEVATECTTITGIGADTCAAHFLTTLKGTLFTVESSSGDLVEYTWTTTSVTPTFTELARSAVSGDYASVVVPHTTSTETVVIADYASSVIVVSNSAGTVEIPTPAKPLRAAVAFHISNGDTYVSWVDENGGAGLAWGDTTSGFTTTDLTLDFAAVDTAVWSTQTGDHIMVGVVGSDEVAMAVAAAP